MADLVTKTQALGYLRLPAAPPKNWLEDAITRASAAIEKYCFRVFTSAAYTEDFDGGRNKILLTQYPVTAVSEVLDLSVTPADRVAEDATTYTWDEKRGYLLRADPITGMPNGDTWGDGPKRWRVTWTGGYASVPADVQLAVLLEIAARWSRLDASTTSERAGDQAESYEPGMSTRQKELLGPYVQVL